MPKKITLNSFYLDYCDFKGFVNTKFDSIDDRFLSIERNLISINQRLDILEQWGQKIDFLYNAVDKFMGEIMNNREERVFINHKVNQIENRVTLLEQFNRKYKK